VPTPPLTVVTSTEPDGVAPVAAPVVHVSTELELKIREPHATPATVMADTSARLTPRLVPVMTTTVPPAFVPVCGETSVTTGAGEVGDAVGSARCV
jgi:hypothetical protein